MCICESLIPSLIGILSSIIGTIIILIFLLKEKFSDIRRLEEKVRKLDSEFYKIKLEKKG